MARNHKDPTTSAVSAHPASKSAGPAAHRAPAISPLRDFAEQISIAFILAFLLRGFGAEAFVIPTGSMAPTLMGMHKDVDCPRCGATFQVNVSEESSVVAGTCGNCRLPVKLREQPTFNGDRILVNKFLFNMPWVSKNQPNRWEVVVFHYPEEPETNYIKRLVGMPNEQLQIIHGDILRRPLGTEEDFQLLRKPLPHLQAMLQPVYDDRYRPKLLEKKPNWQRWSPLESGSWTEETSPRSAFTSKPSETWSTLRYQHLVPDPSQARALIAGEPADPQPRLISDFYSYNSGIDHERFMSDSISPHWVGDLAIRLKAKGHDKAGTLRLTLVEAGRFYHCEIDLQAGQARLFRDEEQVGESAPTPFQSGGEHEIQFANIDGRLTLWVDGDTPFGEGVLVQDGQEGYGAPTVEDLQPVRIASRGGSVTVSDLVLSRDIYYTLTGGEWDYNGLGLFRGTTLSDPAEFRRIGELRPSEYTIHSESYMMLGDNSPRSKDGRGWSLRDRDWDNGDREAWEVPEELLIGKAFYVYWPHGKPFWPNLSLGKSGNFRFPFRPYFERMKWIR